MKRKHCLCTFGVVISTVIFLPLGGSQNGAVWAQEKYPSKPIEIIVTQSAGGQADMATRMLAESMKAKWGQPVVISNKVGGSGALGANALAKAAPDGYTIGSLGYAQLINNFFLIKQLPYQPGDFKSVAQWLSHNNVVVVPPDSPFKDMKELIKYAKASVASRLKYANHGKGSSTWFHGQYLSSEAGIKLDGVPFQGDPAIMAAVVGKHVPVGMMGYVTAKPQERAGKLRMLMTFTPEGMNEEPTLPSISNVLGKDVKVYPPISAIFAPAKTPDTLIKILAQTIKEISSEPSFKQKMNEMGMTLEYLDKEDLDTKMKYMTVAIKKVFLEEGLIKE